MQCWLIEDEDETVATCDIPDSITHFIVIKVLCVKQFICDVGGGGGGQSNGTDHNQQTNNQTCSIPCIKKNWQQQQIVKLLMIVP